MRRRLVIATTATVALAGAGAAALATAGGPPSLYAGGVSGLREAHVGTSYAFSYVMESHSSFTVRAAQAVVTRGNCAATMRFLPAEPEWGAAIPLVDDDPGVPVVGQRLTPANDRRVSVVVTPSSKGTCVVGHVRVARRSWDRDRWADLPVRLVLRVSHAGGLDSRLRG